MTVDGMSIYVNNIKFETPTISPALLSKPYGTNFEMNIVFKFHHNKHLFSPHLKHHSISMNQWASLDNLLEGEWGDLAQIWVRECSFLALGLYVPRALYASRTCKNTKAIDAQCTACSLCAARPLYALHALSVHLLGFKTIFSPFNTPIWSLLWFWAYLLLKMG